MAFEKERIGKSNTPPVKDPNSRIALLNERIMICELCRLFEKRTRAVPGTGRIRNPEIMLVGEAPGRHEDLQGEPFVGAGGKLLDSALELCGLHRDDVFITNIVKCRPPNNRKPLDDEIETCTENYLELQIELVNPKLIVTLGATALQYFTGQKSIGNMRGKPAKTKRGRYLLPTYHPAAILRNRSLRPLFEDDIRKLPGIIRDLQRER